MQTELRIQAGHEKHADVNVSEGECLISLKVPASKAIKIAEVIRGVLTLAGHKVRNVGNDGEELVPASEVFANVRPGMMLRGPRVKENITQAELAERLGIAQNMVSEMESGRRNISLKMAKRLAGEFNVPYKAFL